MHPDKDFVTGSELSRWMQDQSDFRNRLENRLNNQHKELSDTLRRIEDQTTLTNGRLRTAESALSEVRVRVQHLEAQDGKIQEVVESIKDEGCSQFHVHSQLMSTDGKDWSPKKKAAVGGGLVATGVLIWPAIQELATALHALFNYLGPH